MKLYDQLILIEKQLFSIKVSFWNLNIHDIVSIYLNLNLECVAVDLIMYFLNLIKIRFDCVPFCQNTLFYVQYYFQCL